MYISHRFLGHSSIEHVMRKSHRIHHLPDQDNPAHEDFVWGFIILSLLITLFWFMIDVPPSIFIISIVVVFIVLLWNWYIHESYHTAGHWLEKYDWFQKDREKHKQHHINPTSNYGIASHFSDIIFKSSHVNEK
jgi:hypothetical protein